MPRPPSQARKSSAASGSGLGWEPSSRLTLFQSVYQDTLTSISLSVFPPPRQPESRVPCLSGQKNISSSYIKLALGPACWQMWGWGVSLHFCKGCALARSCPGQSQSLTTLCVQDRLGIYLLSSGSSSLNGVPTVVLFHFKHRSCSVSIGQWQDSRDDYPGVCYFEAKLESHWIFGWRTRYIHINTLGYLSTAIKSKWIYKHRA